MNDVPPEANQRDLRIRPFAEQVRALIAELDAEKAEAQEPLSREAIQFSEGRKASGSRSGVEASWGPTLWLGRTPACLKLLGFGGSIH